MAAAFVPSSVADWIDIPSWGPDMWNRTVGQMVPSGYDAAVRVLHPLGLQGWHQTFYVPWRLIAAQTGRPLVATSRPGEVIVSLDTLRHAGHAGPKWTATSGCQAWDRVVERLTPHTQAASLHIAVWTSWVNDPPEESTCWGANQQYVTAELGIKELHRLHEIAWSGISSPTMWWPTDRSWFAHTHIYEASTVLAGTRAAMDDLLADPELETFAVDFDDLFGG